jgi:hypothetical protein
VGPILGRLIAPRRRDEQQDTPESRDPSISHCRVALKFEAHTNLRATWRAA